MTELPKVMTAVHLVGHGGPEMLEVHDDVPVPEPADGEVLIRVRACGMNNTDINTRVGWYSKEVTEATSPEGFGQAGENGTWGGSGLAFPRIQGADPCGEVVAVGPEADTSLLGQRVLVDPWIRDPREANHRDGVGYLGSERDGGFAQYCTAPAVNAYPIESPLSDAELASFPCSWATAEHMLTRPGLEAGETVVVTGASGGVGTALVQLAKLRGSKVVAVTSSSKADAVSALGADAVVDRMVDDLVGAVTSAAAGRVDLLADVVGGADFAPLLDVVRRGGRYATAGAISGPVVDLDLRTLYLNDLELYGCTVYEPSVFEALIGYIRRGEVQPVVGGTYPLEEIRAAQEAFGEKSHVGALVLIVD